MYDYVEILYECLHSPLCIQCKYRPVCRDIYVSTRDCSSSEIDAFMFAIHYAEGEI